MIAGLSVLALLCCSCTLWQRDDDSSLAPLRSLVANGPRPFVVIGGGQGVVVSPDGYVLTAAHVTFDDKTGRHTDEVPVSFRSREPIDWPGAVHRHKITVVDAGPADFYEEFFVARVLKVEGRAHIEGKDVGLVKIDTTAKLPYIEFYSEEEPELRIGDRLYLCHFVFPTDDGEPTFLVSPLEVLSVAETTTGVQYLAQGFFRWGSSGGAILKDGKLIGVQSNAFTVNTSSAGEIPLGHVSFAVVYGKMLRGLIAADRAAPPAPLEPGTIRSFVPAPSVR